MMSSRISNAISIRFPIKTRTVQFVSIPIPTERRERRETKSFSMPPSVAKKLTRYAKKRGMSRSDLLTFLCVEFLDAAETKRKMTLHHDGAVKGKDNPSKL